MNESLRDWLARIAADTERRCGWLELEAADGSSQLVGGALACHEDRVAFEDDSGLVAELRYAAILAVRTGAQGEAGCGLRRLPPDFAAGMAA